MPTPLFRSLVLFTTLFTATAGYGQTASGALELSRQAAVEMAIRKNIDLKAEALNTAMAKAALASSKGIYDPVVTAETSTGSSSFPGDDVKNRHTNTFLGVRQSVATGGTINAAAASDYSKSESSSLGFSDKEWRSSAGVTISQPLLKNFGKENFELNISLANSAFKESAEQLRFFITDTVFLVVASYNRLHKLRQVEVAREAALTSAEAFLKEIQNNPRPGAIQQVEVANAEFAISQRRKDLVDASREVRDEEEKLRFLIGMEEKTQLLPVDPPSREEPAETEAEAVKTALATRPDLRRLRLTLQTSELQERIDKQQTRPDLSVNVSGGFSGTSPQNWESIEQIGQGEGASWTAGLRLDVPIGNTTARNDYLVSRLKTEQVKHQLASFTWQIRNTVEEDMRALISARLQVQVADQSLRLGESRLAEYRKNHKAGISTAQDVIDSENDLIFARIGQTDADETFALSVVTLWRDMGVLLDHYKIHIDTTNPESVSGGAAPAAAQPVTPPAQDSSGPEGSESSPASPRADRPPLPPPGRGDAGAQPGDATRVAPPPVAAVGGPAGSGKPIGQPQEKGYTLQLGEFTSKSALELVKVKIESAGLLPVVKEGQKRTRSVIRLLAGDFAELATARKKLARLRQVEAAGFILMNEERRFCTCAGSFSSQERADKEKKRLANLGIELRLQNTSVPLPTYLLIAGSFPTREAAQEEADKLMQEGVVSVVTENG